MKTYEPGFYWVRYTRGILRGDLEVAHRTEFGWWFIARETERSDDQLEESGIEVLSRVEPPPQPTP